MYFFAVDLVLDYSHQVLDGLRFKLDKERVGFSVKADIYLAGTDVADGRCIDLDDLLEMIAKVRCSLRCFATVSLVFRLGSSMPRLIFSSFAFASSIIAVIYSLRS